MGRGSPVCHGVRVIVSSSAVVRLRRTATKIPLLNSQERNCAAWVQISIFMCLRAIYTFQGSVHIFSCSRIGRPIVGRNKLLKETWMWKLGLRPCNSFYGNICFEFSVLCLCSVGRRVLLYSCWSKPHGRVLPSRQKMLEAGSMLPLLLTVFLVLTKFCLQWPDTSKHLCRGCLHHGEYEADLGPECEGYEDWPQYRYNNSTYVLYKHDQWNS